MRAQIAKLMSPFHKGHASFVGSSAFVQLLPLISAPIVARLYSPTDFGIYAVFFALATILTSISSLALNNAILLEEDGPASYHATILSLGITILFSLGVFLIIFIVPDWMQEFALGPDVVPFLVWLPLTVVLAGSFQCFYNWAIKADLFKLLARNKLIMGVSSMSFQIAIGLMDVGAIGFVIANLLGLALATMLLARPFLVRSRENQNRPAVDQASRLFVKHAALAIWTMPATVVNTTSRLLPDLLINRLFGVAQLGQYSLANRMINFPVSFVAVSVQDIFRQQSSAEFEQTGRCVATFRRFFLIMVALSICLILPVILIVPYVFPIVFGAQWTEAGYLIQATGFLMMVRFISSPLSYVWIVRGQQRLDFFWQVGLLLIGLIAFIGPQWLNPDVSLYATLWIFSIAVGAWYVFAITLSYRFAHRPRQTQPTA